MADHNEPCSCDHSLALEEALDVQCQLVAQLEAENRRQAESIETLFRERAALREKLNRCGATCRELVDFVDRQVIE